MCKLHSLLRNAPCQVSFFMRAFELGRIRQAAQCRVVERLSGCIFPKGACGAAIFGPEGVKGGRGREKIYLKGVSCTHAAKPRASDDRDKCRWDTPAMPRQRGVSEARVHWESDGEMTSERVKTGTKAPSGKVRRFSPKPSSITFYNSNHSLSSISVDYYRFNLRSIPFATRV
jgi:hypothetical protein